ncbi:MAG: sugar phosphate isomerase/epimerase [Clostridia bacterium]|nr:sugar phosphate isomerase/epimerase [Clostridia bacterium]
MRDLMLSAFADEYATSFREQLEALERFGIRYIELRHLDGKNISVLEKSEALEARRMMDAFGIKASAIGSPLGKIRLDGDMAAHLETARRVFELANLFGTGIVRVFSFYAPEGGDVTAMRAEVLEAMARLLSLAREHGVTLCHENEARIYGDTPARCKDLLEHFGGELKCVFDMGNFVLEGVKPYPEAYALLREHIAYFHIKDALSKGAIVPAGKGEAGIGEILKAHRDYAKADFFVSLEPHLQTFSGLNALVGRSFENPYQYADQRAAFADAVTKLKELI